MEAGQPRGSRGEEGAHGRRVFLGRLDEDELASKVLVEDIKDGEIVLANAFEPLNKDWASVGIPAVLMQFCNL